MKEHEYEVAKVNQAALVSRLTFPTYHHRKEETFNKTFKK